MRLNSGICRRDRELVLVVLLQVQRMGLLVPGDSEMEDHHGWENWCLSVIDVRRKKGEGEETKTRKSESEMEMERARALRAGMVVLGCLCLCLTGLTGVLGANVTLLRQARLAGLGYWAGLA